MPRVLAYSARLFVVLAVVLSTQGLLFVQGTFLLRQDYIADVLCVNLDRPELNCEGKCFLTKQLHEQREQEREQQQANLQVALAVFGVVAEGEPLPDRRALPTAWTPSPVWNTGTEVAGQVFHPPRAA